MLEEAIQYPKRGSDALVSLSIGGFLPISAIVLLLISILLMLTSPIFIVVLAVAVVPLIILLGYYVRILREVADGHRNPPPFTDISLLVGDGCKILFISGIYSLPLAVFGIGLINDLQNMVISLHITAFTVTSSLILYTLAFVMYGIVYIYLRPVIWMNFARFGRISAAFNLYRIWQVALTKTYARTWLLATLVGSVANSMATPLYLVGFGFFISFYGKVSIYFLYGNGIRNVMIENGQYDLTKNRMDESVGMELNRS